MVAAAGRMTPHKLPSPCTWPGCANTQPCPTHTRKRTSGRHRETTKARGYSSRWRTTRDAIIKRDMGMCVFCGSTHKLHVHHLDHDPRNNLESNLITLCERCHAIEHRG